MQLDLDVEKAAKAPLRVDVPVEPQLDDADPRQHRRNGRAFRAGGLLADRQRLAVGIERFLRPVGLLHAAAEAFERRGDCRVFGAELGQARCQRRPVQRLGLAETSRLAQEVRQSLPERREVEIVRRENPLGARDHGPIGRLGGRRVAAVEQHGGALALPADDQRILGAERLRSDGDRRLEDFGRLQIVALAVVEPRQAEPARGHLLVLGAERAHADVDRLAVERFGLVELAHRLQRHREIADRARRIGMAVAQPGAPHGERFAEPRFGGRVVALVEQRIAHQPVEICGFERVWAERGLCARQGVTGENLAVLRFAGVEKTLDRGRIGSGILRRPCRGPERRDADGAAQKRQPCRLHDRPCCAKPVSHALGSQTRAENTPSDGQKKAAIAGPTPAMAQWLRLDTATAFPL